jgi:hypothetical protein
VPHRRFDGFLSAAEAAAVIAAAGPKMKRAGVTTDDGKVRGKVTKLAQNLGQLQPFIAAFLPECMGQLASFGPTRHPSR